MRLNGKRIIVTGASRGLGKALALRYAQEGATLAICARNAGRLEEAKSELAANGATVVAKLCDISDATQAQAFVTDTLNELGAIDVLVNNAGVLGPRVTIAEYPPAEWDSVIRTNVNGMYYLTRLVIPVMMIEKAGAIINITSTAGKTGRQKWGAYAVSKFATEGFTQVLAEELKPYNITVNSVNPGSIATDMRRAAYPDEDPSMLRQPHEVTEVFVYLASEDGKGITGQSFNASSYYSPKEIL
jgi:NAD(P)-dependent dehydrogenase (short-subunit alcohol dehydrogenase family)